MRYLILFVALLAMNVQSSAQSKIGNFSYSIETDPITDENRSIMWGVDDADGGIALGVACTDAGMAVMVLHKYLGGQDGIINAYYRFDSAEAQQTDLLLGRRNQGSFLLPRLVESFTRSAREANQVVIRLIDPLDGEVLTSTIPLNGFAQTFRRLDNCE